MPGAQPACTRTWETQCGGKKGGGAGRTVRACWSHSGRRARYITGTPHVCVRLGLTTPRSGGQPVQYLHTTALPVYSRPAHLRRLSTVGCVSRRRSPRSLRRRARTSCLWRRGFSLQPHSLSQRCAVWEPSSAEQHPETAGMAHVLQAPWRLNPRRPDLGTPASLAGRC